MAPLTPTLRILFLIGAAKALESVEDPRSTLIVYMLEGTDAVLNSFPTIDFPSREERLETFARELQDFVRVSQEPVRQYLESLSDPLLTFHSLWLQNAIVIKTATPNVLLHLQINFSNLTRVTPDSFIPFDDPPSSSSSVLRRSKADPVEWGIRRIQAQEAVKLLNSSTSTPIPQIRIATIDTGVRVTHEALLDNYLGDYGWLDPYMGTPEPNDQNGHGTHTTGTICGSRGIGVFPHATWMACKGCATSSCVKSALLECAQFVTCPTLYDKTSPNCSLAPHVVSNSWGGGRHDPWFDSSIAAWHAVGIIPVFSIGNSGATCNTASSPGDREGVIAVGSTTSNDTISSFSSSGPTPDGRIKPDFSAPGSNVISAYHTADDEYFSLSGTSMACPHAAGLAALLLAYDPKITYQQITDSLKAGVETSPPLVPPGNVTCDGRPSDTFPNNIFGHGLVNALRSLTSLIATHDHHN